VIKLTELSLRGNQVESHIRKILKDPYTVLYCAALYCAALYYTVLYCTPFQYFQHDKLSTIMIEEIKYSGAESEISRRRKLRQKNYSYNPLIRKGWLIKNSC
jgi:hypothetical protein